MVAGVRLFLNARACFLMHSPRTPRWLTEYQMGRVLLGGVLLCTGTRVHVTIFTFFSARVPGRYWQERMSEHSQRPLALVIGGSRGIGRAIACRLAESGFDLAFTYRNNHDAAREVRSLVEARGAACRLADFDLADRGATRAAIEQILALRCPEALVYNAGLARDNVAALMQDDEWDTVMRVNLDGFFNVVKPVLFEMIRQRRGRIVAITSVSADLGQAGQVNYSAAKAGLAGAVRALAREVGRKQIFVNAVSPGVIETEMTQALPREQILPLIPLHRFGTPEEVAAVVNFLCTEPQMYVHGQVIGVNGGMAV